VRRLTPSPTTEGNGSAKLMVRKNAIERAQRPKHPPLIPAKAGI
jgi:hypothetical protein